MDIKHVNDINENFMTSIDHLLDKKIKYWNILRLKSAVILKEGEEKCV